MNDNHVEPDELSAYLDGEADDPSGVAAHLERCPDCAQRYQALQHLAGQVQALPAVDPSPALLTRVLATVREETGRTAWRPRFGVVFAGAAAALVVAAAAIVWMMNPAPTTTDVVAKAPAPVSVPSPTVAPDQAGPIEEDLEGFAPDAADDASSEDLLAALADTEWFDAFVNAVEAEADLDTLIESLTPSETATLKDLIREYAKEEQVT